MQALKVGFAGIDTANHYHNQLGCAKAIKDFPSAWITSKVESCNNSYVRLNTNNNKKFETKRKREPTTRVHREFCDVNTRKIVWATKSMLLFVLILMNQVGELCERHTSNISSEFGAARAGYCRFNALTCSNRDGWRYFDVNFDFDFDFPGRGREREREREDHLYFSPEHL